MEAMTKVMMLKAINNGIIFLCDAIFMGCAAEILRSENPLGK